MLSGFHVAPGAFPASKGPHRHLGGGDRAALPGRGSAARCASSRYSLHECYRDFTWHPERFPHPKALTDTLAEEIVRRYRAEDLPLDVLHLDIHYMNAIGISRGTRSVSRIQRPSPTPWRRRSCGVTGPRICRSMCFISIFIT